VVAQPWGYEVWGQFNVAVNVTPHG
jgi:hypothetical protein